ncbi:MAG: hypothetical protein ABSE45_05695 [Candidatus Acidiferrales bacterium]|jgi:hypothetical protein
MTRIRKTFAPAARYLALLPALLAINLAATATTLTRMSLATMSQKAPVIVRARCLGNSTGWDAGEIWTFTSFEIEDVWRGAAPARIVVRLLGGRAGNITSSVSGIPRFHAGEEAVLFLEPTPRGDFSVVSWQQGTFRIRRDSRTGEESVTQDTASFATFDPATRQFEATGIRNLPIDLLRARIEAALRSTGTRRTQ